jgi:diguanylate cyclase (GGDEF)-like protein
MVIPDTHLDPVFAQNPLVTGAPFIRFYAGQPVKYAGQRVGTLCLADRQVRHLDQNQLEDLEALAVWVEDEVGIDCLSSAERELLSQIDELKQVALIDHLTRAWNRAGIEEVYAREHSQARREHSPISLIMIDIDEFKKVNDRLGHQAGDAVLRKVADRIRLSIRPYDALGRMGGDEFLVIMPATPASGTAVAAERIRQRVEKWVYEVDKKIIRQTISIGAATMSSEFGAADELLRMADLSLYQAKGAGRNRSASCQPQP